MNKLKKQFYEMKAKHPDAVLLFRVGDFYEAYDGDAEIVAETLGLTLVKKGDTKMAGFPRHSLDSYLPKLVRAGKRVAMCDKLNGRQEAEPLPKRATTELPSPLGEVKKIHINDIHPSPMNPRKTFDEPTIAELAESIKQHGLLQPITVRPVTTTDDIAGNYEIVMGERRFRAWKKNMSDPKFPMEIPCIVRMMTDEEALDAMITENLQRKDVDPIEEAFAFGQLHAHGKSIEEIALRFGKSARFITERIKLDNLQPELKTWVTKGWMNIGAAMHICKLTPDEQQQFMDNYDAEEIGDDTITKQDAVDFTDNLFMRIDRANWHRNFEGSCGTTCEKCPFNNVNVGCLFYEMKPHDATCTNREQWNNKRASWLLQMITDNADVLVKEGEDLEAGKTIVLKAPNYFDRCKDFQPLLDKIAGMGFRIAEVDDFFERYPSYHECDERLQEKLKNNEVYRCLVVEAGYRGTEVNIRYYTWKKHVKAKSEDEVQAMQLVNEYKENQRKGETNAANKLCELLGNMHPDELSKEPLSQTESLILLTLILRKASHKFRDGHGVVSYTSEAKELNYARGHTDEVHLICRDFIRNELSQSSVQWSADLRECQSMLLNEWAKEKAEEVTTDVAMRLAKKQAKIEEQLTALGYNTDGTKMDF